MVGYSRIMEESETQALELLEEFRQIAGKTIQKHSGGIIKTMGDGLFVAFGSAVDAVRAAVTIQKELAARNRRKGGHQPLLVRIGIHLGDLLQEGEDLFGSGVNVASRIQLLASPGGIYVSGEIYQQVRNHKDLFFRDLGERQLRNIKEPVKIYDLIPGEEAGEPKSVEAASGLRAIAVLPFQNMSSDPDNEYFSDGMTEEIVHALSAVGSLRVASRTSSFAFKGATQNIRTIGEKLQVRTVLEGSVRRADTKLRVTAQLINAADGFHLWSATYEREMKDVFAIQDEIARAIVSALKVKLTDEPSLALVEPRTANVEAYALYLKARYFWRRKSASGLKKGIEYFQQAIAVDPGYSLAYA